MTTEFERQWQVSIQYLVERWRDLGIELESPYKGGIDDYVFDLDTRDILEEALHRLPLSDAAHLRIQLQPLDQHFVEVTTEDSESILARFGPEDRDGGGDCRANWGN